MSTLRDSAGRFVKGGEATNKKIAIQKICARVECDRTFSVKPSLDRIRYCSLSCARKDRPSPWKGRSPSAETREKMRAAKLGIRGPAHWNYRGTSERSSRKVAMARDEYKQWRIAVYERDDYTCQECRQRGGNLHAHHIKPWIAHPNERYVVANGQTLCEHCHLMIPRLRLDELITTVSISGIKHWVAPDGRMGPIMMGGADNVNITPGSGAVVGTRDAGGGVEIQRVIPQTYSTPGSSGGTANDVGPGNPWPVVGTVAASVLTANSGVGALLVSRPGQWSVVSTPATNVQASASKGAGGAGVCHVAKTISATLAAGASAITATAPVLINLRNGGTGAGTVLWSTYVNLPATAGQSIFIHISDLVLVGTAATAMTLEFSAAGGTNSYESVTLTGYDVS